MGTKSKKMGNKIKPIIANFLFFLKKPAKVTRLGINKTQIKKIKNDDNRISLPFA